MAETVHRPALNEIEIGLAVFIPQPGALAGNEHNGWAARDFHKGIEAMA